MSLSSIPLTAVSLCSNLKDIPISEKAVISLDEDRDYQLIWTLEWYWGLHKGALPIKSRLNSFEMRADMLKSYNEDGWILMPSTETLKAIEVMLRHNTQAGNDPRRVFTEEFPAAMHEYRLVPAALSAEGRRPTIYVDTGEAETRQVHYPYSDLPTVECRAHPFFVLHALEDFMLGGARVLRYPWLRPYRQAALRVSGLWHGAPPCQFRWGPDLPLEHRHPKSIETDNSSDQEFCDHDACSGYIAFHNHDRCPGASEADRTPRPTRKRKRHAESPDDHANARPRLCRQALASGRMKSLCDGRSMIIAWIDTIEPCELDLRSSHATSHIAEADAELIRYAREPLRHLDEVMRTGRRVSPTTIPLGQSRDTSRFTSCNWAEEKRCIYLWGYRDASASP